LTFHLRFAALFLLLLKERYFTLGAVIMNQQKTIDTLNSMLRGELSATETYQQALEKVSKEPEAADLRSIHADHREAANEFRKHVHQFGGKPDQGSGAWGAFAKAVAGSAKIFGETAALKALKEGEEQGISSYEDSLKEPDLPQECRTLIQSTLAQCHAHITLLDRLMKRPN
jgi:uncharacterized protein (TIGR02284 family)